MSRAPFVMPKAPMPFSRHAELQATTIGWRFVNPRMNALHGTDSMGETAGNVATEHGVNRADQDAFALRSQQRAARALAAAGSLELIDRTLRRQPAHVGSSYCHLLDERRKSRAFDLMATGQRSVSEIAAAVGFADARAFTRACKRWTGHPPSLVRGFVETWVDTRRRAGATANKCGGGDRCGSVTRLSQRPIDP